MDMTGLDPLADSQAPTMATAFPEVTTRIVEILRETGYPDLADLLLSFPLNASIAAATASPDARSS